MLYLKDIYFRVLLKSRVKYYTHILNLIHPIAKDRCSLYTRIDSRPEGINK